MEARLPSYSNPVLIGTSRCDVPARETAGGKIAPLHAARTAQRAVPTGFTSPRLAREGETLAAMVRCYCRDLHGTGAALCPECRGLLDYAVVRLDRCRFGAEKPTCANCPVHCYQRDRREQMKAVMRHAGPRMLWRHPVLSFRHWLDGFRPAPALQNETAPASIGKLQPLSDENLFLCRRRGDESQIASGNSLSPKPPHVGSYFF